MTESYEERKKGLFDPKGRKKPGGKPGGGGRPNPGGGARPPVNPGGKPTQPGGEPGQPPALKGQSPDVLIQRYTAIVLAQPGSQFPLQRLAQLYRERDGTITNLVKDFEARAAQAGPDQYAATATLAGIYKIDGRADDAAKTFEKAIALKSSDPSAILALARLLQDRGDTALARTRYEQALALQTVATDREQTLRTLLTLALDAKDFAGAKGYHAQLLKMQPTSLFVRGELGRELYARGEYDGSDYPCTAVVQALLH